MSFLKSRGVTHLLNAAHPGKLSEIDSFENLLISFSLETENFINRIISIDVIDHPDNCCFINRLLLLTGYSHDTTTGPEAGMYVEVDEDALREAGIKYLGLQLVDTESQKIGHVFKVR